MKDIKKNIIILLRISYIYIIYTILMIFFIGPPLGSYLLAPPWARFTMFSIPRVSSCYPNCYSTYLYMKFVPFYVFLLFAAVTDYVCVSYISKGIKTSYRIAYYRSLITCLLGFLLFILGRFVFIPPYFTPWPLMIEGFVYFLFYGTIFTLLMINERKERQ